MRNKPSFDWNDLRYLLAIAREGSTLAAARALHVNQSTVQRRLAELEQRLGCALAERHPAGYRLTEQGRRLLPFATRVEDNVHALQRHAATFDARMSGSVCVTCSTTVAYRLTKSALLDWAFRRRRPLVPTDGVHSFRKMTSSVGRELGS
jgi:DNA-binding transcriptional LysR family regulator